MEKLMRLLRGFGEQNLEISSVFNLQFGCVLLLPTKLAESQFKTGNLPEEISSSQNGLDFTPETQKIIAGALVKHSNIFELKIILERKFYSRISHICLGNFFRLKISIPKRLQRFGAFMPEDKLLEEFYVISNGSLFCAFSQIETFPTGFIGNEYREIFRQQIDKETNLGCPLFGPSPIHPNFYVIFRKNQDPSLMVKTYSNQEDVYLVFNKTIDIQNVILEYLFPDIESGLVDFYHTIAMRHYVYVHQEKIFGQFSELVKSIRNLETIPWKNVLKSAKAVSFGRKCLTTIYSQLVDYETSLFSLNRHRKEMIERIQKNQILSSLNKYFQQHSEAEIEIPKVLFSAIEHFERKLHSISRTRVIILASLCGAIAGSILTFILTKILG